MLISRIYDSYDKIFNKLIFRRSVFRRNEFLCHTFRRIDRNTNNSTIAKIFRFDKNSSNDVSSIKINDKSQTLRLNDIKNKRLIY